MNHVIFQLSLHVLGLDPEKHCDNAQMVEHDEEIEQLRDVQPTTQHNEKDVGKEVPEVPEVHRFTFKPTSGVGPRSLFHEEPLNQPICSTPTKTNPTELRYNHTPLPDWMALSDSFLLSPEERQRQRDMSFGMRLPIEPLPEEEIVNFSNNHENNPDPEPEWNIQDELDLSNVEPPSPIFQRSVQKPISWQNNKPTEREITTTPTKTFRDNSPSLEPIFELNNSNLKNKLVQVLNWTGCESTKLPLRLKISDGSTWIETTLCESYRIYLVGNMLRQNNIIKIQDYTGTLGTNDLVLVRFLKK